MYRSGENLYAKLSEFIDSSERLVIFVPYIQARPLQQLLKGNSHKVATVITSWKAKDLLTGVSDIEVFKTCAQMKVPLLLNNRLHAKVYVDYPKCSFLTTANISNRALGLETQKYNYELGCEVKNSLEDIVYLDRILMSARQVTQAIYDAMKQHLKKTVIDSEPDELGFVEENDPFLLSALPMSKSLDHIYRAYSGDLSLSFEEKQSAFHDLSKYAIPSGLDYDSFVKQLREKFFAHNFIKKLLEYNGEGRRFGELRRWIQNNTTSVPVPRSFEINDPLNHVYDLVTELSEGRYQKIQPGKRTWVLKKIV